MTKPSIAFIFIFTFWSSFSQATLAPSISTYQGRIVAPDGKPVESKSVKFTLQVISPGPEECKLYEEIHQIDMSNSDGVFQLPVGQGGIGPGDPSIGLSSALANNSNFTTASYPSLACTSGSDYTPSSGDTRKFRVSFEYPEASAAVTVSPDLQITSVPYAMYASRLEGYRSSDFIKTNYGGSTVLNQSNLESIFSEPKFSTLTTMLTTGSGPYASSADFVINGATGLADFSTTGVEVPDVPDSGIAAVNQNYADANLGGNTLNTSSVDNTIGTAGYVLTWNHTTETWVAAPPATDSSKLSLSGGTLTGPLNMGDQNLTNINDLGVNEDLIVGEDLTVSGGIAVANGISSASPYILNDNDDSNSVSLAAPTDITSDYTITFPASAGSTNNVMYLNSSGNLVWGSLNHGNLTGLSDDDHTQYVLLAGRGTGQTLNGGANASGNLTLDSTANATKGNIVLQPSGGNTGVGDSTPDAHLEISAKGTTGGNAFMISSNDSGDGDLLKVAETGTLFVGGTTQQKSGSAAEVVGNGDDRDLLLISYANGDTDAGDFEFYRAHGTEAAKTAVDNDDKLGAVSAKGWTGSEWENSAQIQFYSDGGTVGASSVPSRIEFFTTPDGGNDSLERMVIKNDGDVGIGVSSPGTTLDIIGAFSVREISAPALSPADQGRIYFDTTANKFKVSEHGGAYVDLVPTGLGTGDFLADGTVQMTGNVRLNGNYLSGDGGNEGVAVDADGDVGIGTTSPSSKLHINGGTGTIATGLTFGDGDTGFYEISDDSLVFQGSRLSWKCWRSCCPS